MPLFGTVGALPAVPAHVGHLGQGVKYPLSASNGKLELSYGEQAVLEAVTSICQTQPGERVMNPPYGADTAAFEPVNPERAAYLIQDTILEQEPRVDSCELRAELGPQGPEIHIEYSIIGDATRRVLTAGYFDGPDLTLRDGTTEAP
jgi:phage baseplate assembly protein W